MIRCKKDMKINPSIKKLHFVYNVDAAVWALITDFIHRWVAPETYPCRLCDLTYGRVLKKPRWCWFLKWLPVSSVFYTRDQFVKKYPELSLHVFPIVFAEHVSGEFLPFMTAAELTQVRTLMALKQQIRARLQQA